MISSQCVTILGLIIQEKILNYKLYVTKLIIMYLSPGLILTKVINCGNLQLLISVVYKYWK